MNRENWFLVLPTLVLGLVALYTLHQVYATGDVRRAVMVVRGYQAPGMPTLSAFLEAEAGAVSWSAQVVSRLYGTVEVSCRVEGPSAAAAGPGQPAARPSRVTYRWRVDIVRRAFAPADEATRDLMRRYQPDLYGPRPQPPPP